MLRIVILNGPNLNMLGRREPNIYGTESMEQVMLCLQREYPDVEFIYKQSNHEGDLIDWIQHYAMPGEDNTLPCNGIILNAGGYTHTSIALRDAVAMAMVPIIEVHISDIRHREAFRQVSLLSDVCAQTIMGIGTRCYPEAATLLINNAKTD